MMHYQKQRHPRGSTLLAVFWVMAVMGMAIVASMRVVSYQVDVVNSQLSGIDALRYAERGVAIAANPAVEKWDPLLQQTFEDGGGFETKIISEGARFNINYILMGEDKALMRLILAEWGIELDVAEDIADALTDWVDTNDTEELNGAEHDYYEDKGFFNYPFNRPFYSLDEMRLVRGMDIVEAFQPEWRDWFTVWSEGKLDINDARAELIKVAIEGDIEDAIQIIQHVDGPDGIRHTEDDLPIGLGEAINMLGLVDDQGLLQLRLAGSTGSRTSANVRRIESIGFVGEVRRKIILIYRNPQNPQILVRTMSAKKGDNVLMIPGAEGWEVWVGTSASGFEKVLESESRYALDVDKIPSGPLDFALPVRQLVALPFKAQTDDLSLLGDLATMHLERHGVRPALDGGELADYFVYSNEGQDSVLTPVVLNPPVEGDLPRKSPRSFDVSARCFSMPEGKVAVWRELGRWIFGIGNGERILYFQCLPGEQLDERAGRDVRLALTQLGIQGVLAHSPTEADLWLSGGSGDPRQEEMEAFARGANLDLSPIQKPLPHWPMPPSRLLPADVRAERVAQKGRRNRNIMIAAAVLAYLGIVGFFFHNYQEANKDAIAVEKKVQGLGPEAKILLRVEDKWDELAPVVESDFYPYEVYHRIVNAAPRGDDMPLRLEQATVTNQFRDKDGEPQILREIAIRGNAAETKDVAKFNNQLKKSEDLKAFEWIDPPPQTSTAKRWKFEYSASAIQ